MARPQPIIVPGQGLQSNFTQGNVDLGAILKFFGERRATQQAQTSQDALVDFLAQKLVPEQRGQVFGVSGGAPETPTQPTAVGQLPPSGQERSFVQSLVRAQPAETAELARGLAFPGAVKEELPLATPTDIDDFIARADEEATRTTGVGLTPGAKNKAALEFKRAQAVEVRANKFAEANVDIATAGQIAQNKERGVNLARIASAGELAKAKGEITPVQKIDRAKIRMQGNLAKLANHFLDLDSLNAIVNTDNPSFDNILASAKSSSLGQAFGTVLGTNAQSIRNSIKKLKPLLIQDIRQSTDMGARGLDSEKELEFYLQAVSDEKTDIQSNIAAIVVLDEAFGRGEVAAQLRELTDESLISRISQEGQLILGGETRIPPVTPSPSQAVPTGNTADAFLKDLNEGIFGE
jgi:hypothetical protein